MNKKKSIFCSIFVVAIALLTGCARGPEFQRPAPPHVTEYTSTPVDTTTSTSSPALADSQEIVSGEGPTPYWWRTMSCRKLETLINEALEHNPTLMAAEATMHQAQELHAAQTGHTAYPQVEGGLNLQRRRFNPGALGQGGEAREFSLYNASLGVHYTFDLAGGNRSALEALAARSDYQLFQLEAARLTLIANIVTTAISQASTRKQIEIVNSILKTQEKQLELMEASILLGRGEPADALALQTQIEQRRATLPLLHYELQTNDHLLAVLVGKAPGEASMPSFSLEDFTLPSELPLLIPSELVRARPDILGAEALLEAANADYGVAISKLYPQFTLGTDLGSQALTLEKLFDGSSAVWDLVGQLTQPLFKPGLAAEKRAALAAFDAAAANYQHVVLEALRNVADVLRAIENDSKRLEALAEADDSSEQSLETTQRRYELGATSYYEVLIAEQSRFQTELDVIEGQAKRLINTVAFYQAMGGGLYDFNGSVNNMHPIEKTE